MAFRLVPVVSGGTTGPTANIESMSSESATPRSENVEGAIYLLQATLPPAVVLALGWADVFGRETAYTIAAWLGVVALFAWGFWLARREGYELVGGFVTASVNASLGVVIVILKILVE